MIQSFLNPTFRRYDFMPGTPAILPFSQAFHPTPEDVETAIFLLKHRVPPELALLIVSFGYNPWLVECRDTEQNYQAAYSRPGAGASVAGIYLSSQRIPFLGHRVIPQRIIFQTRAGDQGWTGTWERSGTFTYSNTWFEASILRPIHPDTANALTSTFEDAPENNWWDVASSREYFNQRGWDFVQRKDGQITWRVCTNILAQKKYRNYRVEWRRGVRTEAEDELGKGNGEGFLELLEPGSVIILWARAQRGERENRVSAATIEIQYQL
ncbi:hypothetical protein F5Y06DRAFT_280711, partial [Hypoxylon sp. FL0890]